MPSRNQREGYYAGRRRDGPNPGYILRHRRVSGEYEQFALRNLGNTLKASTEMSKELHGYITGR